MKKTYILFAISIVVVLLVSCAPSVHRSTMLVNKLPDSQESYYLETYEATQKDESFYGYSAIKMGLIFKGNFQKVAFKGLEIEKTPSIILLNMNYTKVFLSQVLTYYHNTWSSAIEHHVDSEYSYVNFNEAFSIISTEFARLGVYSEIDTMHSKMKNTIMALDNEKYPRIYELYSILSQLTSLAKNPTGSLMSFSQKKNELYSELDKVMSLAEIEAQKN